MTLSMPAHRDRLRSTVHPQFDRGQAGDIAYMVRQLLTGYLLTVERDPSIPDRRLLADRLFLMELGEDEADESGRPLNEFEHLISATTRPRHGSMSWLGPVSTAALARVLVGRVDWKVPSSADDQQLLERFALAPLVQPAGATVDAVVRWALQRNSAHRYGAASSWGVTGLSTTFRPAREVSIDRVRPSLVASEFPEPSDATVSPLLRFAGVYQRSRAGAHELVFGRGGLREDPRLLPRFPGLLLCAGLTIEYLTTGERSDDLIPPELVDDTRLAAWNRIAFPVVRMIDPDSTSAAAAKTCQRAAEHFPWLVDLVTDARATADDEGGY